MIVKPSLVWPALEDTKAPSAPRISMLMVTLIKLDSKLPQENKSKAPQIKRPQANPYFLHNDLKIQDISAAIALCREF